jgi:hypothetical protein
VTDRKRADEESFDQPVISQDRRSVGWSVERRVDATYAITADASLYQDRHDMAPTECPGGVTEDWHFEAGGRWVVFEQAFPHGLPQTHWCPVDIASGKVLGRMFADREADKLPRHAPKWAR